MPNESFIYIQAGMYIAVKCFNERSSTILSHLSETLQDCNIYLTIDILDKMLSPIVASWEALEVLSRSPDSLQEPFPISLAGSFRSAVSQHLAILFGVCHVPHANGQSTSSALDNKDQAPTFVRVVPTNRLDAKPYVLYLQSLGIHHFSVLYIKDANGTEFNRDLKVVAEEHDMRVFSVSYQDGVPGSINRAIHELKHDNSDIFLLLLYRLLAS
jgi:hypothetical protein